MGAKASAEELGAKAKAGAEEFQAKAKAGAEELGAKAKTGLVLGLTAQNLLLAVFIVGVGAVSYGIWRGLADTLAPGAAALAVGGILLAVALVPALIFLGRARRTR